MKDHEKEFIRYYVSGVDRSCSNRMLWLMADILFHLQQMIL